MAACAASADSSTSVRAAFLFARALYSFLGFWNCS